MFLERLTRLELEAASRESPAVLPLGSCEQHGAHLSFGADNLILDRLAERAAAELGDRALWLSRFPYAHSGAHAGYPGTISLPVGAYMEVLAAAGEGIAAAGFTKMLFLNGQRGNESMVEGALRILRGRRAGFAAVGVSYWDLAAERRDELFFEHGGCLETSLTLHLDPSTARMECAKADGVRRSSPYAGRVAEYARTDQRSRDGGLGDPTEASAELGKQLFEEIADSLARLIGDLRDGALGV